MRIRSVRFPGLGNSLIAALVLLFNVAPAAASPVYRVQELFPPSGDVWAFASALNARGEVVGFSLNELGISSALKWWRGSTEVLYPATVGDDLRGAQAYDINDLGQAVGTQFGYLPNEFGGVYIAGAGPIVWGAGDIRAPSCDGDDGARQISNASVVLNFRGCAYTIDSADAEFLSPSGSAWERLYENGLVLNGQGTFGQALWGGRSNGRGALG